MNIEKRAERMLLDAEMPIGSIAQKIGCGLEAIDRWTTTPSIFYPGEAEKIIAFLSGKAIEKTEKKEQIKKNKIIKRNTPKTKLEIAYSIINALAEEREWMTKPAIIKKTSIDPLIIDELLTMLISRKDILMETQDEKIVYKIWPEHLKLRNQNSHRATLESDVMVKVVCHILEDYKGQSITDIIKKITKKINSKPSRDSIKLALQTIEEENRLDYTKSYQTSLYYYQLQ